jgi:DNA-binding NarL/FixJ family response regulator
MKILLLDDHQLFRSGLRLILEQTPGLTVIGEAGDGPSALEQVGRECPDVMVVDIHLPGLDGIEVARRLRAACPSAKVVFLSSDADSALVRRALEAGASGYLLKENAPQDLIRALEAAAKGGVYLCPEVASVLVKDYQGRLSQETTAPRAAISEREREVLQFIAEGLRNKEMAVRLNVSIKSVETYRARLLAKLGYATTAQLIRHAIREGIVPP